MAVKLHVILTVFKAYGKFRNDLQKPVEDEKTSIMTYVKRLNFI